MPSGSLAFGVSLTALAMAAIAAAGVGWSPIACGCVGPADALRKELRLPGASTALAPEAVERAVNRRYAGRKIELLKLPGVDSCAQLTPTLYRCTYWLWQRPSWEKGLEMTINTQPSGVFRSATVLEAVRRGSPSPPP